MRRPEKPNIVTMPLSALVIDAEVQPRVKGLDKATVEEYRERYKAGDEFPALVAYGTKRSAILSEGFHRAEMYRLEEVAEVQVELREGGKEEATLNALASNKGHGLKRTNADKRAAVERLLALRPTWADRRIADFVGVHHQLPATVRAERVDESSTQEPQVRERSDGRTFTVPAKPKPVEQPKEPEVVHCDDPEEEPVEDPQHAEQSHDVSGSDSTEPQSEQVDTPEPANMVPDELVDGWFNPALAAQAGWNDPPPKPADPEHPFAEIMNRCSSLSRLITQAINADGGTRLKKYLSDIKLVFHQDKMTVNAAGEKRIHKPTFIGLRGLRRVVKLAGMGGKELSAAAVVKEFENPEGEDE